MLICAWAKLPKKLRSLKLPQERKSGRETDNVIISLRYSSLVSVPSSHQPENTFLQIPMQNVHYRLRLLRTFITVEKFTISVIHKRYTFLLCMLEHKWERNWQKQGKLNNKCREQISFCTGDSRACLYRHRTAINVNPDHKFTSFCRMANWQGQFLASPPTLTRGEVVEYIKLNGNYGSELDTTKYFKYWVWNK